MKNRFLKIVLVLSALVLTIACNTDDATNDSTMTAAQPSLTVSLDFANSQSLIEADTDYGFTVSISQPQIAAVVVYLSQTGGDATNGEDFEFPASITIPAGQTSASGVISILSDELAEATETVEITIGTGNESNVQGVNSQVVTFNIINLVEGDLAIGLMWNTDVFMTDGSEFDPTDLADLRLLITDVPYTTILGGADGGAFESTTLESTDPDGEYYVVADWFAAYDLGQQGAFGVDLTATFDQVGVINGLTFDFANALNSASACSAYYILAKITKTGDNYEIESVGEASPAAAPFIGTATVVTDDWADYAPGDEITIEANPEDPNQFFIRAYTNPFIANPDTAYMIVTVDPGTNTATVMSNEAFEYGCTDGTVTGNGNVNPCEGSIDLVLTFNLGNCGSYPDQAFSLQL